ncbi:MAG: ribosome biogenesis GTPase Der [Clostridiales bacterium]|jgi:GTP-binding protein|nr:ribosome biogenesis GTPase Der [Clostridiales bacterium]
MQPIVAIVGRPNVGKSTLFNRIVGSRLSIVEDTPGVTRDRLYAQASWQRHNFLLVDTGGLDIHSPEDMVKHIRNQAQLAIETATVVLFLVDGKSGLTEGDQDAADILRRSGKPVVLVVNKLDDIRQESLAYEFYALGLGEPLPISAANMLGLGDMLDIICGHFPADEAEDDDDIIKVAIIGKPNVGKSSIINRILGEERVIVTPVAGTTRDAVDTFYEAGGQRYMFIDTAGIRRKSKIKEDIEKYSLIRAVAAVERCDVAILVISAEEGITDQDTKIAGISHEMGKAGIIVVNKWDLIEKDNKTMAKYDEKIDVQLKYMAYAPRLYISALSGQRVMNMLREIRVVAQNAAMRVQTGVLNEVLVEALARNQPPAVKGQSLKVYYMTQVSVKPPTFILFVNNSELMHFSYRRYIENQIRLNFGFKGTPIHFIIRNRS